MILAIIGTTGLVGREIIKVLEEKNIKKIKSFLFVATNKNVGKKIKFLEKEKKIISINEAIKAKPNFVIFSAGSKTAKKYAHKFTAKGAVVIDNSSAFRMEKKVKLIVPEVNIKELTKTEKIISNPNCSTIQLVLVINKINELLKIKRMIISTYQAVSGSGKMALNQLNKEEENKKSKKIYPKKIHRNIIPQCDDFLKNGYTKEEDKIIKETNKILKTNIKITATAVRVPTIGGHGESVNIETKEKIDIDKVISTLKRQKGIVVSKKNEYITPLEARGKNEVFVSRIRRDHSIKNGINMWIVADPLRKGAATNTVQILNHMINIKE
ncbi:MAG: aspartate-semialdehyde dehydrogenase [Flavobacteriales bacterium]|nr:aspartate-semialdehyde dehydrogenase [Flavobacteriales bacterium]|tara:strand:- start:6853 stop:7830 length:978 start_codon:yes stop_codon:yes gene_type:complete